MAACVVDEDEGLEGRRSPHELEGDARSELHVRHVLRQMEMPRGMLMSKTLDQMSPKHVVFKLTFRDPISEAPTSRMGAVCPG